MNIQHDVRQSKFFTFVEGKEYSLEYNVLERDLWEFHCPFISNIVTNIKERDTREMLIEYALYYMDRNNIRLLESGTCHSVNDYILDREKFKHLVYPE